MVVSPCARRREYCSMSRRVINAVNAAREVFDQEDFGRRSATATDQGVNGRSDPRLRVDS